MKFEELESKSLTPSSRSCEPCTSPLLLGRGKGNQTLLPYEEDDVVEGVVGSHGMLKLVQDVDGSVSYMFLTEDGRLVPVEDF